MSGWAVEAVDVRKRYGETEALRGVSLAVPPGQVFAVLGPNGAGKSTLVSILTTLLPLDAGTARVAGYDVTTEPKAVRSRIGVTFQESVVDLGLSGREVLFYHGRLYGMSGEHCRRRIEALRPLMALDEALDRRVKTYSGGMKRRLELARALLTEPDVVFLDEPSAGLDPQNREALWEQVRALGAAGRAVLFTTHYMEEAERFADRVAVVDHGEKLTEGTPAELMRALGGDVLHVAGSGDVPQLAAVLLASGACTWAEERAGGLQAGVGESGPAALGALLRAAEATGYTVTDISVRRPNLNEVFLKLTGRSLRD